MFHHIMVGSNDIERSKQFYDAVLATLGAPEGVRDVNDSGHTRIFYKHDGDTLAVTEPINDSPATAGNGATVLFECTSEAQAKAFHATALAHGAESIEAPPGIRTSKAGPIFLAYVRDPDGNKLGAIYREK